MKSLLPTALDYAGRYGWAVHPVGIDKKPTTPHGFKDATTDEPTIRDYFKNGAQLGVATGPASGVFVLDVDHDPAKGIDGHATLAQLIAEHGPLPRTPHQRTGRGGLHYFFKYAPGLKNSTGKIGPGLDTRGEGGYVVVAPSQNTSGAYEWLVPPSDAPLADVPGWLVGLLTAEPARPAPRPAAPAARNLAPYIDRTYRDELLNVLTAQDGEKHNILLDAAIKLGTLIAHGLDERTIIDGLHDAAVRNACDVGYDLDTIGDGIEYGRQRPRDIPDRPRQAPASTAQQAEQTAGDLEPARYSDLANARRLVAEHGDDLRFVAEWGWLVWDGCRWALDATAEHQRRAKATAVNLLRPAADETEHDRDQRMKYARAAHSAGKIAAMISLAESESAVRARPDDFDNQQMLLTCANGAIDLTTGDLLPHDRTDLLTKATDILYDKHARAPQWLAFLDRIFAGDQALISYVQRAIGYTLTGSTAAQCMFILYGKGANGKSVLIDVLRAVLGDYARNADSSTFMTQQTDRIRSDVARLAGARFVATVEIDEGRKLSEALVKQVSSGDRMTARFLNKNDFEFTPRFKLWMATNHKPVITGTDYAIWRRIKLIPFTVTIPEAERDLTLTDKLLGELPGILAWAVQGCVEYQAVGLQEPDAVRSATNAYKAAMDELGTFMDECTVSGERHEVSSAALYAAYVKWSAGNKQALTQRRLGEQMNERGIERIRRRNGFYYLGLGLVDTAADNGPLFDECDPCDPCDPNSPLFQESDRTSKTIEKKDHKDHKDHTLADSTVRAIPYRPNVNSPIAPDGLLSGGDEDVPDF